MCTQVSKVESDFGKVQANISEIMGLLVCMGCPAHVASVGDSNAA